MVLGPHTAHGNITQAIEHSVEWQTGLLRFMREHHYTRIETRPEHVAAWTETVLKAAEPLLSSKVDSWQTGVNRNVEGRNVRRVAYPLAADNVSRLLPIRLKGVNQPVIRT